MMNIKETCCIVLIFFVLTNTGTETVRASNRGRKCESSVSPEKRFLKSTIAVIFEPNYAIYNMLILIEI